MKGTARELIKKSSVVNYKELLEFHEKMIYIRRSKQGRLIVYGSKDIASHIERLSMYRYKVQ